MNDLILSGSTIVKINSREISELTGKRHDVVLRDIRVQLSKVCSLHTFEETYINEQNKQEYICYSLPKRETLILVSGYSVELRAKIIDRLEFLEKIVKPKLPTHVEALRLYADQLEENEQLKIVQMQNAPKVEYYEEVLNTDNSFTTQQVAEEFGMTAQFLNNLLKEKKIQYKKSGQYMLYVKYKGCGYSKTRTKTFKRNSGIKETTHYTVWTEKGRKFLHQVIKEDDYILDGLNG